MTSIGGEAIHPIPPAKLDSLLVPAVHCSLVQVPTHPGEKVSDPKDIDDVMTLKAWNHVFLPKASVEVLPSAAVLEDSTSRHTVRTPLGLGHQLQEIGFRGSPMKNRKCRRTVGDINVSHPLVGDEVRGVSVQPPLLEQGGS